MTDSRHLVWMLYIYIHPVRKSISHPATVRRWNCQSLQVYFCFRLIPNLTKFSTFLNEHFPPSSIIIARGLRTHVQFQITNTNKYLYGVVNSAPGFILKLLQILTKNTCTLHLLQLRMGIFWYWPEWAVQRLWLVSFLSWAKHIRTAHEINLACRRSKWSDEPDGLFAPDW